ncbi:hypothetical protein J2T17_004333 [Paenibacillus mucilaginosus]
MEDYCISFIQLKKSNYLATSLKTTEFTGRIGR